MTGALFLGEFIFEVEDRSPRRREAESYEKVGIIIVVCIVLLDILLCSHWSCHASCRIKVQGGVMSRVVTSSKKEATPRGDRSH